MAVVQTFRTRNGDKMALNLLSEEEEQGAAMLAANAVHLATMLKERPYPGIPESK
jgi:hypothetical protein